MANNFSLDKPVILKAMCAVKYEEPKNKKSQGQVHSDH